MYVWKRLAHCSPNHFFFFQGKQLNHISHPHWQLSVAIWLNSSQWMECEKRIMSLFVGSAHKNLPLWSSLFFSLLQVSHGSHDSGTTKQQETWSLNHILEESFVPIRNCPSGFSEWEINFYFVNPWRCWGLSIMAASIN